MPFLLRRLLETELLELDPRQSTRENQGAGKNDNPRLDVECVDVVCGVCGCHQC